MSNTEKNICSLCLKKICGNDFDIIEDVAMQMFDGLLLKLELNKNENVMCCKCATDLQKSFDFKLACISLKNKDVLSAKESPTLNPAKACSLGKRYKALDDRKACRFCAKLTEADSFTCLNATQENMLIVDMLQQHIPELELSIFDELISCEVCLKSLQHLLSFTTTCSHIKQQVKQYSRIALTDDKSKIRLNGLEPLAALNHINSDAANEYKIEEVFVKIEEDFTVKTEMKSENMEIDNVDASNEWEETGANSEQSDSESYQNTTWLDTEPFHKCSWCPFKATDKSKLKTHLVTHQSTSELMTYKYDHCSFKTKERSHLQEHTPMHETISEATLCKIGIAGPMVKHRDCTLTKIYSCPVCLLKIKRKHNIKKHMLIHKDPSHTTMYKCAMCLFETKYKSAIKRHMVKHKDRSQTKLYSCPICSREFKHKHNVTKHVLLHQNPSEITKYKCEMCTYETRHKSDVKRHMLTHTRTSEKMMYKCEYCPFVTKFKNVVKAHASKHEQLTGMVSKCDHSSFETKQKSHLQEHTPVYKISSEITVFKCDSCPFETKYESSIKRHIAQHTDPFQAEMTAAPYTLVNSNPNITLQSTC